MDKKGVVGWSLVQILSVALVLLVIGVAILIYTGLTHKLTIWSCCFGDHLLGILHFKDFGIQICSQEVLSNCG